MTRLRVGIISGTGFSGAGSGEPIPTETAWGDVVLTRQGRPRCDVYFLPRHGPGHRLPPHGIDYRAVVAALRAARVDYVISLNNVGSLRRELAPRQWLVPHDFLDWTRGRPRTFFDAEAVHADLTEPYCPEIRAALLGAARGVRDGGVYVATEGPRFETAAEVRALANLGGDVVGMTGLPEAVLAREAGLCYASLCWIGNHATGVGRRPPSARRIASSVADPAARARAMLIRATERLPRAKRCRCASGMAGASLTASAGGRLT